MPEGENEFYTLVFSRGPGIFSGFAIFQDI